MLINNYEASVSRYKEDYEGEDYEGASKYYVGINSKNQMIRIRIYSITIRYNKIGSHSIIQQLYMNGLGHAKV